MPKGIRKVNDPPKEVETVSKQEFASLQDTVKDLVGLVSGFISKQEPKQEPTNTEYKDVTVSLGEEYVPPEWRQIINERLGEDFKAKLVYPISGLSELKITVPISKSNMAKANREYYKNDNRTIIIKDGIQSVRAGVEKIRANLKIN